MEVNGYKIESHADLHGVNLSCLNLLGGTNGE